MVVKKETTDTFENWDIPIEEFKWRISNTNEDKTKARYVPFPDARVVAKHLDRIFGWNGWSDTYEVITAPTVKEIAVICTLTITDATGKQITKQGFGNATEYEPWKGAESDAFKRAAAKLGVGRNAYDVPEIWADTYIAKNGKVYSPRGIETTLVALAHQKMGAGEQPERNFDTETIGSPPMEEVAAVNVQQTVSTQNWKLYTEHMKSMTPDQKAIIKEWWAEHGDGKSKPSKDMDPDLFDELLARIITELFDATPINTEEDPF